MDRVNRDRVTLLIGLEIVVAISIWIVIGLSEREATEENGESNMITFDFEFVIDANDVIDVVNEEVFGESRGEATEAETEVIPVDDITLAEPWLNTTSIEDDIVAATETIHDQGKVWDFRVQSPFIPSSVESGNVGEDSVNEETFDITTEFMEVTESVSSEVHDVINSIADIQLDSDTEHNTDSTEEDITINPGERPRKYRRVQERINLPSPLWICPVMTGGECQHCLRVAQRRAQRGQVHLLDHVQD